MMISGDKVQLRSFHPDDFAKLTAWSIDEEVNKYLEGDYPQTIEECAAWLQKMQSDRHTQQFAVATLDGAIIGDIELDHITWRSGDAELRIRIGEKQLWDNGYGTDAVLTMLSHAFRHMSLSRIYLRVFTSNTRAIRCYEKAGFRKEGRLKRRAKSGEMEEILLMRILRDEYLRQQLAREEKRSA